MIFIENYSFMQIYFLFIELKFYKIIICCIFVKINYCNKAIDMNRRYTKTDLDQIVSVQLENLNVIHDLLSIIKHQNPIYTPEVLLRP